MPEYFDVHSHINFSDYGQDLQEVISRMKSSNTWTTVIGTSLQTSTEAVELANKEDGIFACIGVHPVDDKNEDFDELRFEELVKNPKVVAIGECGLDYFRIDAGDSEEKERQKKLFVKQIEFALNHDKSLMIHSRAAYDDLIDILSIYKKQNSLLKGNIHFFSGDLDQAKKFVDLEFTVSFAGPITFARDYDSVIAGIPLTSILSETDSPFATPTPYRGKRNEPAYVAHIAAKIAEVRGEDINTVKTALVQNAFRLFKLG